MNDNQECKREEALNLYNILCPRASEESKNNYITVFCSECQNTCEITDECQSRLIRKDKC